MTDESFLIVRLGSLGDIVHTLPAASALRDSRPGARIDWVVESRWLPLLAGNPDLNDVIALERDSWGAIGHCVAQLRKNAYTCVLDFQGLYKSAVLAWSSGAPKRIGWAGDFAREGLVTSLYTHRVAPSGPHKVDQNIALAESACAPESGTPESGAHPNRARRPAVRFPIQVSPEAEAQVERLLATEGVRDYFMLSPGGGWRSKCWPAEQYGQLHRRIVERSSLRGVISFGPGEQALAEAVRAAAGAPAPLVAAMDLPQLMAALRHAKFFVGGDTGPLHLAVALGTPVIGLYGPTDPARNGPYSSADVVVRNAGADQTTYKRSDRYSPAMLSISVEQVLAAIDRRMGWG